MKIGSGKAEDLEVGTGVGEQRVAWEDSGGGVVTK
jgi:hypothetical protein